MKKLIPFLLYLFGIMIQCILIGSAHAQLTGTNGQGPDWKPKKHKANYMDTCVGLTRWMPDDSFYLPTRRPFHPTPGNIYIDKNVIYVFVNNKWDTLRPRKELKGKQNSIQQ
jgi:hypothetical protein